MPWNLPLYLLTFKLAPALVTGNTVVCKPSEMTSVTTWMLCKVGCHFADKISRENVVTSDFLRSCSCSKRPGSPGAS